MAVRGTALLQSSTSTFNVKLDGFRNHELSGFIYNPVTQFMWPFNSTLKFVDILETYFDSSDFPQSTNSRRAFEKKPAEDADRFFSLENNAIKSGADLMEKPTFVIRVQYRQNSTWQGSIQWVEQKKTQQFRSVLEMLKLMEDVVDESFEKEDEPIAKWTD